MRSVHELMDLHGKHAVVTGGTGWLGHAMAEALIELGANVTVVSRGESQQFGDQLQQDGIAIMEADLTTQDGVDSVVQGLARVDILINNMCVWPKHSDFLSEGYNCWEHINESLTDNLTGQLYFTKAVVNEHMPDGGCIINVSSMYGKMSPDPKLYENTHVGIPLEFSAAKAALAQATRYMAAYFGHRNIRCNSISPGLMSKPTTFADNVALKEEFERRNMLGRVGTAEDMKGAVVLLATDLGTYITGEDIAVDGGWTSW